jgi:hypothetical protein
LKVFQDYEATLAIGGKESQTIAGLLEHPGLFDQRRALADPWLLWSGFARGHDAGRPARRRHGGLLRVKRVQPA